MPHRDDGDDEKRALDAPGAGFEPAAAARDASGEQAGGDRENGDARAHPSRAAGKKRARALPQDVTNSQEEDKRGGARRRGAVEA
jgi:hypothetical protein